MEYKQCLARYVRNLEQSFTGEEIQGSSSGVNMLGPAYGGQINQL